MTQPVSSTKQPKRATRFPHAIPIQNRHKNRKLRRRPKPPFKDANGWETSIYYWWWFYLREHEGYKETCLAHGAGTYAALYVDFGDIHSMGFWDWWRQKGTYLFAEPPVEVVRELPLGTVVDSASHGLVLALPTSMPIQVVMRQIRREFKNRFAVTDGRGFNPQRPPKYAVATRYVLSSLHTHLQVLKLHRDHPDCALHEIADMAGIKIGEHWHDKEDRRIAGSIRSQKASLVSRHLRIARQYLDNVAKTTHPYSEFPKRSGR